MVGGKGISLLEFRASEPNPPTPFPQREGGEGNEMSPLPASGRGRGWGSGPEPNPQPPSLGGKGAIVPVSLFPPRSVETGFPAPGRRVKFYRTPDAKRC